MTCSLSSSLYAASAAALAATLTLSAVPAYAQGTPEQREACAPDALRLCADAVPDVAKTTACMRAHHDQLSAVCKTAFDAGEPAAPPKHVAHATPTPAKPTPKPETNPVREARHAPHRERVTTLQPMRPIHHTVMARGSRDTREARRVIGRLCGARVIDAGTCGFMGRMLTLAE